MARADLGSQASVAAGPTLLSGVLSFRRPAGRWLAPFARNARAADLQPAGAWGGFVGAWVAFFGVLLLMPLPARLGMLSNVAAVALLAPVLPPLAQQLGLNPIAFTMLIADTDTFAYILPTQITAAVIAYSTGVFSAKDYAKVGVVSVVIAWAYGLLVMAPWYALLGLPVWDPAARGWLG